MQFDIGIAIAVEGKVIIRLRYLIITLKSRYDLNIPGFVAIIIYGKAGKGTLCQVGEVEVMTLNSEAVNP